MTGWETPQPWVTSKKQARTPSGFTQFVVQQLGVDPPIGRRAIWYTRLKQEMKSNGWGWDDMIATVEWVKTRKNLKIRSVWGVLYYVNQAKRYQEDQQEFDLHAKVSELLASGTLDERWQRKLSLAQGEALRRVYQEWRKQHEV